MKAAVMFPGKDRPQYTDFPEPVVQQENALLVSIKAAAVKHLDKSKANGKHYSTKDLISQAAIIGGDGVGLLQDGKRVYAIGNGMLAEKAIVEKDRLVLLPEGIDDVTAAALPNAVIGSAMALRFRAGMKPGETVLINGATGFTGRMAVQVARHYGAKKIIVTGRNEQSLQALLPLGAEETVPVQQEDAAFVAQIKSIHAHTPIDVIIDYLWGHTAELILAALKGSGSFTHKTRFVSIGAVAGDIIQLSAENLRSVDLQLSGSGLGSWTKNEVQQLFTVILPEMFQLAAGGQLKVDTISVPLQEIEQLWNREAPSGKRWVVTI